MAISGCGQTYISFLFLYFPVFHSRIYRIRGKTSVSNYCKCSVFWQIRIQTWSIALGHFKDSKSKNKSLKKTRCELCILLRMFGWKRCSRNRKYRLLQWFGSAKFWCGSGSGTDRTNSNYVFLFFFKGIKLITMFFFVIYERIIHVY